MTDSPIIENDFVKKITGIIEKNISNEQFGVSELAREIAMSRSNLLRKIKKLTKLSVSQFIRQVRLKTAMEMLRQSYFTVSEISYKVGFGSTSYFIKCFHDYYGYSPGEVGKRDLNESDYTKKSISGKRKLIALGSVIIILIITGIQLIVFKPFSSRQNRFEKSIAVLPFKNDSNDSTNVHIINGLMESILDNLQKIEDLRVISRTSVEKYRNNSKLIPEMASELNVNYFVEGSGQKIGDQIKLNIQLIEASNDKHLLSEEYIRDAKDIFNLQIEVAKNIAGKIQAIITPEEEERISKAPTENLIAYDYFLKGLDLFYKGKREYLEDAIIYFKRAIEQDSEFARAFAGIAIAYYFLDFNQAEKKYSDSINYYADKALLYDEHLAQSLIAKALYYVYDNKYESAVSYLEKALLYNPNSALVINILADFYTNLIPDTEKYLEYALKGIKLDIAANDSITTSYIYMHLSNAFMQSGFIDEAEMYINKSLEFNSENLFSEYIKAYILFARDRDFQHTKELLIETLSKDSTRYDILKEIFIMCYYMRDYPTAYYYYKKIQEIKEANNLDIFSGEGAKIGLVFSEMGIKDESAKYFNDYKDYAEKDKSIYKHLSLSVYYSYMADKKKAVEHLKLFSQEDNYFYWLTIFLRIDPLFDNIKDLPEFEEILNDIESKFWNYHKQIKTSLEEKELL